MFKVFRRWWAYLTAKLSSDFNERADPKIQLEQAITEAQEQQRRLKEWPPTSSPIRKQTEIRLNRAMGELEKVGANARQAVLMADEGVQGRRPDQGRPVHGHGRELRQPADRPGA